jgi:hypothetical protein
MAATSLLIEMFLQEAADRKRWCSNREVVALNRQIIARGFSSCASKRR